MEAHEQTLEEKITNPIPTNYGAILGCCLTDFKKNTGKTDKGLNRLFRIIVSESMYMIWKIRCERTITWGNDPTKHHSPHEIHNKWLQTINSRLRIDNVQKNSRKRKQTRNRPQDMEKLPKRRSTRNQKLVRKKRGF